MANKPIPHPIAESDEDDVPRCSCCGELMHPMTDGEIFAVRMRAIGDILDDATVEDVSLMLGLLLGEHVGNFVHAKGRQQELAEILAIAEQQTRQTVAQWVQHKREVRAIRKAGGQVVLMPDVSNRLQ